MEGAIIAEFSNLNALNQQACLQLWQAVKAPTQDKLPYRSPQQTETFPKHKVGSA